MSRNLEPVALAFAEQTTPKFVTIPTNALTPDTLLTRIERILHRSAQGVTWHVNVSVDGIGVVHDQVRGVTGNFEKCMKTLKGLLLLRERYPNLRVAVHTVVSTYTVDTIGETVQFFRKIPLDNHIFEIAEQRFELGTRDRAITPYEKYACVTPFLKEALRDRDKVRRSLRYTYYDFVQKWTRTPTRQYIPCMAGVASCHITEKGLLTSCCTRWIDKGCFGDLRQADYDIKKLWLTPQANRIRESIKRQECACPLASAAYSSLLVDPRTFLKILKEYVMERKAKPSTSPDEKPSLLHDGHVPSGSHISIARTLPRPRQTM